MIENPKARIGMIAQKRAEIHFMSQGYSVCWPAVDNGFDLLIHKSAGEGFLPIRVQVKSLTPSGSVILFGAGTNPHSKGAAERSIKARHLAKMLPRHYDLLVVVCDEYVWVIPEANTRGITGLKVKNQDTGGWLKKSKWDQFREERLDGRRPQTQTSTD